MAKRITMGDIALEASVSQATVSLVLNNVSNTRVSVDTRDRVRAAALKLNYVPKSPMTRNLDLRVIGLLIDEVGSTPFATQFMEGARAAAAAQGCVVSVFCTGGSNIESEAAAIRVLETTNLVGILYVTLMTREVDPHPALANIPTILLNCHAPGNKFTSVVPGDVAGSFSAVQNLIKAGHQRIGYIGGETWGEAARDRIKGYRQALATHDIPFDEDLLVGPAWTVGSGREQTDRLLGLPKPPTAIACFNDRVAIGCYEAIAMHGLQVAKDISVIGFDDENLVAHLFPPLSTIQLPHEEMAKWAAERLLERDTHSSAQPGTQRVKIECSLVSRDSVGPLPSH